jgi:hypothetical protein
MTDSRKGERTPVKRAAARAASMPSGGPAVPTLPSLALETHLRDQKRRKKARRDLHEALESHFATLSRYADIEITKLAEIVGAYACEIYDSGAEGYLAIPSTDPEVLFGMAGPLNIGLTLDDVEKCLSALRVRRPWKISSDPVVRLFDDGRELMELHYEPWLRQEIANIVTRRVQDTRKAYEGQFWSRQAVPQPENRASTKTPDDKKGAQRREFMTPFLKSLTPEMGPISSMERAPAADEKQGVLAPPKRTKREPHADPESILTGKDRVTHQTAADLLGVSVRRVRQLVVEEGLHTLGIGHAKQISVTSLRKRLTSTPNSEVSGNPGK